MTGESPSSNGFHALHDAAMALRDHDDVTKAMLENALMPVLKNNTLFYTDGEEYVFTRDNEDWLSYRNFVGHDNATVATVYKHSDQFHHVEMHDINTFQKEVILSSKHHELLIETKPMDEDYVDYRIVDMLGFDYPHHDQDKIIQLFFQDPEKRKTLLSQIKQNFLNNTGCLRKIFKRKPK